MWSNDFENELIDTKFRILEFWENETDEIKKFYILKEILEASIELRQLEVFHFFDSCFCCENLNTIQEFEANKFCVFKLILQYGISKLDCVTKVFLYDSYENVELPLAHYYWLIKSRILLDVDWLFFEFSARKRIDLIEVLLQNNLINSHGNNVSYIKSEDIELELENFCETDRKHIKNLFEIYKPRWITN